MAQIQQLPEQFSKNGNGYRLHTRGDKALIYSEGPEGKDLAFEVFQIRIQPAGERFGRFYPAKEMFPPSEAFGKWAVWCKSLDKALQWFSAFELGPKQRSYGEVRGIVMQESTQVQKS